MNYERANLVNRPHFSTETVPPITPIAEGSDGAEDEEDIPPSRPLR